MRKRKRKLSEQSLLILKAIGYGMVDFINVMTDLPPDTYASGAFRVRYREPYKPYKRTYDLKRNGYITIKRKQNKSFFSLTPKGRLELLKYLHLEKIMKKKWDGRWRIIIFDIPEKMRKWRDYLRMELKKLGFTTLQESVYITPYPVTKELERILTEWRLKRYCRYVTGTELDGEDELIKEFNIKK